MAIDGDEALRSFREHLYGSFTSWGDALFKLLRRRLVRCGPRLLDPLAQPVEPEFSRSHGSLYKALRKGRINEDRLRRLLVANRPVDWPAVFAVDASTWARCDAETAQVVAFTTRPPRIQPVSQSLPDGPTSGFPSSHGPRTAGLHRSTPCASRRGATRHQPPSNRSVASSASCQKRARCRCSCSTPAMTRLPSVTTQPALAPRSSAASATTASSTADPPPRPNRPPGSGGRPPRHGKRWKCSDPATWTTPPDSLVATDPRYGTVTVTAWHGVHPRLLCHGSLVDLPSAPIVKGGSDPSRSRAPPETDRPHKEDALAVVVGRG